MQEKSKGRLREKMRRTFRRSIATHSDERIFPLLRKRLLVSEVLHKRKNDLYYSSPTTLFWPLSAMGFPTKFHKPLPPNPMLSFVPSGLAFHLDNRNSEIPSWPLLVTTGRPKCIKKEFLITDKEMFSPQFQMENDKEVRCSQIQGDLWWIFPT